MRYSDLIDAMLAVIKYELEKFDHDNHPRYEKYQSLHKEFLTLRRTSDIATIVGHPKNPLIGPNSTAIHKKELEQFVNFRASLYNTIKTFYTLFDEQNCRVKMEFKVEIDQILDENSITHLLTFNPNLHPQHPLHQKKRIFFYNLFFSAAPIQNDLKAPKPIEKYTFPKIEPSNQLKY